MPKFLIIRFSSIGDIVLTTPIIRCLKKQVKGAEVHFLTKKLFAPIVEHNPFIDKVHLLSFSWELMIQQLQLENYDYIIDLHHNWRTLRIKNLLNVPSFSFNKLNVQKWIYTNLKLNLLPEAHIVERYLNTIKSFGVLNDGEGLDYFIEEKDVVQQVDIPSSHLFGFISIVIGAAHSTKKLPIKKLQELCIKINYPIILLGGKEDVLAGSEIAKVDTVKIYNACGKFKLNESADLVRKSKLIISHDTGLMHIAAAFKKSIISVWGNTVPTFGMFPYYGKNVVPQFIAEVQHLKCRPCSKIGFQNCPKGHFNCMNLQRIDEIVSEVNTILNVIAK